MKLDWERVEDDLAGVLRRARVPGGWIYRHTDDVPVRVDDSLQWGHAWSTSITFVPDLDPHMEDLP